MIDGRTGLVLLTVILATRGLLAEDAPAPLPADEAAATFTAPPGFRTTLFAGEPDITQPIAMTTDGRGRLWVVECLTYPEWRTDGTGNDRVLIFEDTNGDGQSDSRKVFLENGSNLSGVAWGLGGAWLCSMPNLIFVPDRNGDDIPDGPAEVVLDGWDLKARHNAFNGLQFGPDGWLYGCNGILSNSRVGVPGTPDDQRVALNCGVWRYHPTTKKFEVVASGTTNPWGLDFDAQGRMFITNCVIEHVFEVVPGGHYKRMFGEDLTPNTYMLMETCADHIHWGGGFWDTSIGGIHNEFGGGHAHSGAMIYLGDNWPAEYRGNLFTLNIHGQRLNRDTFRGRGSGVVASHAPDFAQSHDPWFRATELMYGADGGVYILDWNDTGECHDSEADAVSRETGRIFKITYQKPAVSEIDLTKLDDLQLAGLQYRNSEWQARTARVILQERATQRTLAENAVDSLRAALDDGNPLFRLRSAWALHCIGQLDAQWRRDRTLKDPDPFVRGWTVRLEVEEERADPERGKILVDLARTDPSPVVRLELAAALQRVPTEERVQIAGELLQHAEDADDRQIPLMVWYGILPLAGDPHGRDLALLAKSSLPLPARLLSRRIATMDGGIERLVDWLAGHKLQPAALQSALTGLRDAVEGRRSLAMPANWPAVQKDALATLKDSETKAVAHSVGLAFGDSTVFDELFAQAANAKADNGARAAALELLIQSPNPRLIPLLQQAIADPELAGPALRGLAAYDDPQSAEAIIGAYGKLSEAQREDAISTLASHAGSAVALLDAIAAKRIDAADVSAYTARQLLDYSDSAITDRVRELWGHVRTTPAEKKEQIAAFRTEFSTDNLAAADLKAGRNLFKAKCAQCHTLYGEGGKIGPDLTGSQRSNLDYVLSNVVDPSAVVPREYAVFTVLTAEGRLVQGVVPEQNERVMVLQTPTERIVIDRNDIDEVKPASLSMMPEGLLESLTPAERRDLVGYLSTPAAPASE